MCSTPLIALVRMTKASMAMIETHAVEMANR